jgi:hypothetical protein
MEIGTLSEEKEHESGFSLKARVDRVIWVSCKSEFIAAFRVGGREKFERERESKGHPWIILIRDGENVAKAFSKSIHPAVPKHSRVRHVPHLHEIENMLDVEADVQVWHAPYSYDIDVKRFLAARVPELCKKEKNSFLESVVSIASTVQKQKDWLTNGK